MPGPRRARLPDRRRWHFQHGPIDLVLQAFGPAAEAARAHEQAWARFAGILEELASELPALRQALSSGTSFTGASVAGAACAAPALRGAAARRMVEACAPHAHRFVTPMAAVAGAVADEILAAMLAGRTLARAYVNNGGDIALHLAPGERFRVGLVTLGAQPEAAGAAEIDSRDGVGGIASSGWRGRSLSLGIADSVTVIAASAAAADAAATLVANAVDVASPAVARVPARDLDPDSDLGARKVTVGVGRLSAQECGRALARGAAEADAMVRRGLIGAAALSLAGRRRVVGRAARRRLAAA